MLSFLKDLNINYEYQKRFEWSDNKIYDFYLKDFKCIIELHGAQHYKQIDFFGKNSLENNRFNDCYKKTLALANKVDKYIEIECSITDPLVLYDKFKQYLSSISDVKNLNKSKIIEESQSNKVYDIIKFWNDNYENVTSKDLSSKFGLAQKTIIKILKQYSELGLCNYNSKEQDKKYKYLNTIKIFEYDFNTGKLIREFRSKKEVTDTYNITLSKLNTILDLKDNRFGFIFKREIFENVYSEIEDFKFKRVARIDLDSNNITLYETVKDVILENPTYKIDAIQISCKNNKKYKNSIWKYEYYSKRSDINVSNQ